MRIIRLLVDQDIEQPELNFKKIKSGRLSRLRSVDSIADV